MTAAEKSAIANFLDTASDYITTGYKSAQKNYDFKDDIAEEESSAPPLLTAHCSLLTEKDSLERIASEINACYNCPLGKTRKNAVPGEGVRQPLVLVVGEGPGADEDATGRPFVGKAGQKLDEMLKSINLSRNTNCFIANVVKCRPPGNREPAHEEAAACAHFLRRQICCLKPKFILLAGNISAQALLKTSERIGKIHGKFANIEIDAGAGEILSIPAIATYHPSAHLHSDQYKRAAWEDLKTLRSKIENG
jgi:DNA polymerase